MSMAKRMDEYVVLRNKALRELDVGAIKKLYQKYNPRHLWPTHDDVYEIMVHKSRCHLPEFEGPERELSEEWLKDHGYTNAIMGHKPEE